MEYTSIGDWSFYYKTRDCQTKKSKFNLIHNNIFHVSVIQHKINKNIYILITYDNKDGRHANKYYIAGLDGKKIVLFQKDSIQDYSKVTLEVVSDNSICDKEVLYVDMDISVLKINLFYIYAKFRHWKKEDQTSANFCTAYVDFINKTYCNEK